MPSEAKYSSLEHSGLEVVDRDHEAPEFVARDHEAPIAYKDYDAPQVLERTNSLNRPIPVSDDPLSRSENGHGKESALVTADEFEGSDKARGNTSRRYCGLTKKWLIIACIVLLLVVIGAVVGGVVGAVTKRNKDAANNAQIDEDADSQIAMPGAGLSIVAPADGSSDLLVYYGYGAGIYENVYLYNGSWSQTLPGTVEDITHGGAGYGTPIAAISYYNQSTFTRQIFYQSESGILFTQTATQFKNAVATSWTEAVQLSSNPGAVSNSTGLAACVGNFTGGGLNDLRVYYGTNTGLVQELQYSLTSPTLGWQAGANWTGADTGSGIACATNFNADEMDVYWRNSTSGTIYQSSYAASTSTGKYAWTQHALGAAAIAPGSDIAVAYDSEQTQYVFFQQAGGALVRATTALGSHVFDANLLPLQTGAHFASLTKVAAAWLNGDAWYVYQNGSSAADPDASRVWLAGTNRNGLYAGAEQAVLGVDIADQ